MLTPHQKRSLKRFAHWSIGGWERAAGIARISAKTFDALVLTGYLEERRDGPGEFNRWLRLTEKGKKEAWV